MDIHKLCCDYFKAGNNFLQASDNQNALKTRVWEGTKGALKWISYVGSVGTLPLLVGAAEWFTNRSGSSSNTYKIRDIWSKSISDKFTSEEQSEGKTLTVKKGDDGRLHASENTDVQKAASSLLKLIQSAKGNKDQEDTVVSAINLHLTPGDFSGSNQSSPLDDQLKKLILKLASAYIKADAETSPNLHTIESAFAESDLPIEGSVTLMIKWRDEASGDNLVRIGLEAYIEELNQADAVNRLKLE